MCDSWVYNEVNQNDLWIHGDSQHGSAHHFSLSDGCHGTFLMHRDHTHPFVIRVKVHIRLHGFKVTMYFNEDRSWAMMKSEKETRRGKRSEWERGRNEVFGHSGRDGWKKVSHCVLGRASAAYLPGHRTDNSTCSETQRHIALKLTPRGAVKVLSSHSPSPVPL